MRIARIIAAFLIAPLMTPLVFLGVDHLQGQPFNLAELMGIFVIIGGFSYAATVTFGVPAFFLFHAKRWNNIFLYMLAGCLIGTLVSVILSHEVSLDLQEMKFRGWCALSGALSAVVFRVLSGLKFDYVSRVAASGET